MRFHSTSWAVLVMLAMTGVSLSAEPAPMAGDAPANLPQLELPRLDRGKAFIELPTEHLLAADLNTEVILPPQATAPQPVPNTPEPVHKKRIEAPVKRVLNAATSPAPPDGGAPAVAARSPVDRRKVQIQSPLENIVAESDEEIVDAASNDTPDDNPPVEPGKIAWHDDFAAACQAAQRSGKPVLLFHLMGQLDQRFT